MYLSVRLSATIIMIVVIQKMAVCFDRVYWGAGGVEEREER